MGRNGGIAILEGASYKRFSWLTLGEHLQCKCTGDGYANKPGFYSVIQHSSTGMVACKTRDSYHCGQYISATMVASTGIRLSAAMIEGGHIFFAALDRLE